MQISSHKMVSSMKWLVFAYILLTMNITKVINLTETIKFNMAFSDFMILLAAIVVFITAWRNKSSKVIFGLPVWILLIGWIIISGYLGIRSNMIIDSGWVGVLEELVKTGLCIIYFLVGYHTLKVIRMPNFKRLWSISTIVFVFGGLLIYILAVNGIYIWSNDPKYFKMFMGTDTDPNHAATFLTISFFAMGIFSLTSSAKIDRVLYLLVLLSSILGALLTGSRGGLIGMFLGVLILFLYYLKKNWKLTIGILCLLIIAGLIFIQIDFNFFGGQFVQRVIYKFLGFESGLDIRWSLGYSALKMGLDYPITGVGRGNFILNSRPYFNEIGMPYINDIPHNTYFGIFSELGLIGFILFLMPVWLLLITILRRYKEDNRLLINESEVLVWIIAAAISLGVQAFVLNVENRRFLWYLMGVLVFMFQSKEVNLSIVKVKWKSIKIKFVALIFFVTCCVYSWVAFDVYIQRQPTVVSNESLDCFVYILPMKALTLGEENEIGIYLELPYNSEVKDLIKLSLIEVDAYGKASVLTSDIYNSVSGNLSISFVPSTSSSSVFVELSVLDKTLETYIFKPVNIITQGLVYELDKCYFLQPPLLRNKLINNKKIPLMDYIPSTELSEGLNSNFSSYLKVKNIDYQAYEEFDTNGDAVNLINVSIQYEVLESLKSDYEFVLLGYPFYLNGMEEMVFRKGFESYQLLDQVKTSLWQKGGIYKVSFIIPRNEGVYFLCNGIYIDQGSHWQFLISNEGLSNENNYLSLGWINLNEHLLKD